MCRVGMTYTKIVKSQALFVVTLQTSQSSPVPSVWLVLLCGQSLVSVQSSSGKSQSCFLLVVTREQLALVVWAKWQNWARHSDHFCFVSFSHKMQSSWAMKCVKAGCYSNEKCVMSFPWVVMTKLISVRGLRYIATEICCWRLCTIASSLMLALLPSLRGRTSHISHLNSIQLLCCCHGFQSHGNQKTSPRMEQCNDESGTNENVAESDV